MITVGQISIYDSCLTVFSWVQGTGAVFYHLHELYGQVQWISEQSNWAQTREPLLDEMTCDKHLYIQQTGLLSYLVYAKTYISYRLLIQNPLRHLWSALRVLLSLKHYYLHVKWRKVSGPDVSWRSNMSAALTWLFESGEKITPLTHTLTAAAFTVVLMVFLHICGCELGAGWAEGDLPSLWVWLRCWSVKLQLTSETCWIYTFKSRISRRFRAAARQKRSSQWEINGRRCPSEHRFIWTVLISASDVILVSNLV